MYYRRHSINILNTNLVYREMLQFIKNVQHTDVLVKIDALSNYNLQ